MKVITVKLKDEQKINKNILQEISMNQESGEVPETK